MHRRSFLKYTGGAFATAAIAGTVGCGDDDDAGDPTTAPTSPGGSTPGASPTATDAPLADSQVLRARFARDLLPMDPNTIFGIEQENVIIAFYSGLVRYDGATEMQRDLAKDWETPDDTTFVFNLVPGAKWQKDYGIVTAEDFVFSYNRIKESGGTYAKAFELVDSFTALDDTTLEVKLSRPDPHFLHNVAPYQQGSVINARALQALGDDHWFNPVGTGPFMLENVQPGQGFKLNRFNDYFMGPATLEQIDMQIIGDLNTAAIALQNGDIDVYTQTGPETVIEQLNNDPKIGNANAEYSTITAWTFNTSLPILTDPKVRKAIAHAVDWAGAIAATTPISARAVTNILPPWMPEFTDDVPLYAYDPKTAKDLLSAAGMADGFTAKFLIQTGASELQTLIQAQLAAVGIDLQFDITDRAGYNARRTSGDFEISSRGLPSPNVNGILFPYLHPDNISPKGFNSSRYSNPAVTELLEAARSEVDTEAANAKYHEIQKLVMEDLPYIPQSGSFPYWHFSKNVVGLAVNNMPQGTWYPTKIVKG